MADYPTRRGNVVQVALTNDSWTRSATKTTVHPLTCGEMLSGEVTLERRNGPRRLSHNDDDAVPRCSLAVWFRLTDRQVAYRPSLCVAEARPAR